MSVVGIADHGLGDSTLELVATWDVTFIFEGCWEDRGFAADVTGAVSAVREDFVEVLVRKPSMSLGKSPAISPAATTL